MIVIGFLLASRAANLPITGLLISYVSANLALIFLPQKKLRSRWVRLIPDLLDVLFISLLIWFEGNVNSIWFMFYVFPLISVARYWGRKGSLAVAGVGASAYSLLLLLLSSDPTAEGPAFTLRCLYLVGIAFIAGNLTKDRQLSEVKLIEMQRDINNVILRSQDLQGVYEMILLKAMDLTDSKRGHIRCVEVGTSEIVAKRSYIQDYQRNDLILTGFYSNKVIETKKPLRISVFTKGEVKKRLGNYIDPGYPPPHSALFVPLIARDSESDGERVMAVVALYTHRRGHYSRIDEIRLQSFSQLLEVAEKQARFHRMLRDEANERQSQLLLLRGLNELIKTRYWTEGELQEVISLVMERIKAEEAAIFRWDEGTKRLVKVSEASTSKEVTERLREVEKSYALGESLTGSCFADGTPRFDNDVARSIEYAEEYSRELKSGKVSHIMSIPLFVADRKVGVLRVLNKRAADYLPEVGSARLNPSGFTEDDRTLLEAVTTQIVIALYKKELFEEVIKNTRYLERVINYSPYSIIVVDRGGEVRVFNNKCELTWQRRASEAVGESVIKLYESREEAKRIKALLVSSPDGQVTDEDARIKTASGHIIPIKLSASLIKDDEGHEIGSVGMFKDLREERQHEEMVLMTTRLRAIAQVMGHISHDVKNKLVAAKMELETLRNRARRARADEVVEGLNMLEDTLVVTASKLNNIALTESFNVEPPKKEQLFVEAIFDDYFDYLVRLGRSSGTKVTINNFAHGRYRIDADVDQMHLIFMNLYDNSISAIKEAKRDGDREISVAVGFEHEYVRIEWRDNGCGIAPADLGRIFELRYTTKRFGSGLGLYWVRTIIESHGGNISVDSELRKETIFTLRLPILYEALGGE